jgi:hypothetical protein
LIDLRSLPAGAAVLVRLAARIARGARPIRSGAALLTLAAVSTACARSAVVQPPPTPVYAVSVSNATGVEIVVSYDDGTASRALGTVPAGRTERFVIAAPASTSVRILSRAASGDTSFSPVPVALVAGATVDLTVR